MINLIIIRLKFVQYDKVDQVWNVLEKQMADEVLWTKLSNVEKKRKCFREYQVKG